MTCYSTFTALPLCKELFEYHARKYPCTIANAVIYPVARDLHNSTQLAYRCYKRTQSSYVLGNEAVRKVTGVHAAAIVLTLNAPGATILH